MTTEVKFSEVARLISRAFRGAKSRRTVKIRATATYHVSHYWSGGSCTECVAISRTTGLPILLSEAGFVKQTMGNPYNQDMGEIPMREDFIIIEHVISCGKDLGYRIVVHPNLSDMSQHFRAIGGEILG